MAEQITAKRIVKRVESLRADRALWESFWQDLAFRILPHKAYITRSRNPGERLDPRNYDSTAIWANQMMAAGLQGHMTNPASKWFALRLQDRELMRDKEVKVWLKTGEDKIFDVINSSNFHNEIHEVYLDLGCFGTNLFYEEEDEKDVVRFHSRPIEELFFTENARGRVEEVYRVYNLTAEQAVGQFGENNVGEKVRNTATEKPDQKFGFIHLVKRRDVFDASKRDKRNMPWLSVFVDMTAQKKVSEGGFIDNPFMVTRFLKVSGVKEGFSPSMTVFPDITMVNAMSKTVIQAAQKIVSPPLVMPHDGFLLPLKTNPNGINYKISGRPDDKIEPLITKGNIPIGLEMVDRRRALIERAFFVDLFLLLAERPDMTATEVIERAEEKMLLLGPILGRLMNELLDPVIERTFSILFRNGLIPPPPEIIQGQRFQIEYVSKLARAQKISEVASIERTLLTTKAIAEIVPSAIDKINTDKAIDVISEVNGTPPEIIRDDDEVKEIREAQAKAIEAENKRLAVLEAAKGAKDVAGAVKDLRPEAK